MLICLLILPHAHDRDDVAEAPQVKPQAFDDNLTTTRPKQAETSDNNGTAELAYRSCLCDIGKQPETLLP